MSNLIGGHQHRPAFSVIIDGKHYEFDQSHVTSLDILEKANKNPPDCYSVYKGLEGCDFELIRPDEVVDLREIGHEKFSIKAPVVFNYLVNEEPETTDLAQMTPLQIMQRAAIDPAKEYLVRLFPDKPELVLAWHLDTSFDMVCNGMKFVSRPWVDVADIEQFGKTCQKVPVARQYKVKIQNKYHLVDNPYLSVQQVILLGGKPDPTRWDVLKFLSNQADPVKLQPGDVIDLLQPCILHFVLQPKQQTEGRELRRQFALLPDDQEFLNQQGLPWETLLTPQGYCLLIEDFPIPKGYNVDKAKVALIIPPTYPASEIDMAYFYPVLALLSGRPIKALTEYMIGQQSFQRWSRHRGPGDWQPGVDNIATHLHLVKQWLLKEKNS
ncbi:multiubiquitin domain-containing protein [Chitinophaga tropicalis]|uniref:Multi-ubiquitin domain-containing protein n=1 Tax=Chitinophaga tropicalis TaxID=2683588 RepID=A0A7K1U057_9BACT|nr:multiubiquitin domain-containing protein [Chitinophaga tropicalis]MVT07754.1 hypothetical protein [Chitinophaga tropicalis]